MTDPIPPETEPGKDLLQAVKDYDYEGLWQKVKDIAGQVAVYLYVAYAVVVEAFFFVKPGITKTLRAIADGLDKLTRKDAFIEPPADASTETPDANAT